MTISKELGKEVEDKRTGKKLSVRFGSVATLPPDTNRLASRSGLSDDQ
jgi:hypothetical protein